MQAKMFRKVVVGGVGVMGPAALVVSACAIMAVASTAQALEYGLSPWLICSNNKEAAEVAARYLPLEPANGATVLAGTPVVFSGESNSALTFDVASSAALLSSPDIDSGAGAQSGSFFKFASTKATATPRTIYWTASFTFTPHECESPSTFTTPVRTLIVAPTEEEIAATKRQQEEAIKKKLEEEAAAGSVVLDGLTIDIENSREAAVKLTCSDVAACVGRLTLTTSSSTGKGKTRHAKTESVGAVGFSIAAGKQARVMVPLYKAGRALLKADHGHLRATLTIVRTSPLPNKTQTQRVRLEQQKAAKAKGSK
jgi:hypothetical protein